MLKFSKHLTGETRYNIVFDSIKDSVSDLGRLKWFPKKEMVQKEEIIKKFHV
jgi:hypothetical protein